MWRSAELDRALLALCERLTAELGDVYPAGTVVAVLGRCADRIGRVSESRFPNAPVDDLVALVEQAVRAHLAPSMPTQRRPDGGRLAATG